MKQISTQEYAALTGKSERAIQKALVSGRLEGYHDTTSGGRGKWWVNYDELSNELSTSNEPNELSNEPNELSNELSNEPNELSNELSTSNEPNELSNEPVQTNFSSNDKVQTTEIEPNLQSSILNNDSSSSALSPVTGNQEPSSPASYQLQASSAYSSIDLPSSDFVPSSDELPEKYESLARLRAGLCSMYLDSPIVRQSERMEFIVSQYNYGLLCPELREVQGKISSRTLYRWLGAYKDSHRDYRVLADNYFVKKSASLQIQDDVDAVLGAYLKLDRKKQSLNAVLDHWEYAYRIRNEKPPCSRKTIQRRINHWVNKHRGIYVLATQGQKGFMEKIVPTEIIDYSLIKFMDLVFADGKVLNFFVTNPYTGKPCRPILITFFEATTRMPIGFSLDFTENYRSIGAAYRNACLYVGYIPKWIKFDNGFAFKSKAIMGKRPTEEEGSAGNFDIDLVTGLLYRSGVEYISLAQPYNGKGKAPLERWHGVLNTKLESFIPSYVGSAINDKPTSMNRNESWMLKLRDHKALTVQETKQVIDFWTLQMYAHLPHPALSGNTPKNAYEAGLAWLEASTDPSVMARKIVNKGDFNYLMLSTEVKKLSNNGIKINGITYYNEDLMPYIGQSVVVRYDLLEDRIIVVYDDRNQYITHAGIREASHPMASQAGDLEQGQLSNRLRFQRRSLGTYKRALIRLTNACPDIDLVAISRDHAPQLNQDSPLKQLADTQLISPLERCTEPVEVEGGRGVIPEEPITPIYPSDIAEHNSMEKNMYELLREAYKDISAPTDEELYELRLSQRLG